MPAWRGVFNTTLYDKDCQWLTAGQWFSLCTLLSSTNKTNHHKITEILLKVELNTYWLQYLQHHGSNHLHYGWLQPYYNYMLKDVNVSRHYKENSSETLVKIQPKVKKSGIWVFSSSVILLQWIVSLYIRIKKIKRITLCIRWKYMNVVQNCKLQD